MFSPKALAVDDKGHVWENNTNMLIVKVLEIAMTLLQNTACQPTIRSQEYRYWGQHLRILPPGNDPQLKRKVLKAISRSMICIWLHRKRCVIWFTQYYSQLQHRPSGGNRYPTTVHFGRHPTGECDLNFNQCSIVLSPLHKFSLSLVPNSGIDLCYCSVTDILPSVPAARTAKIHQKRCGPRDCQKQSVRGHNSAQSTQGTK